MINPFKYIYYKIYWSQWINLNWLFNIHAHSVGTMLENAVGFTCKECNQPVYYGKQYYWLHKKGLIK